MEYFASKFFTSNILAGFKSVKSSQVTDSRYFSKIDLQFFLIQIAVDSPWPSLTLRPLLRDLTQLRASALDGVA
jgi:hypothetical protein